MHAWCVCHPWQLEGESDEIYHTVMKRKREVTPSQIYYIAAQYTDRRSPSCHKQAANSRLFCILVDCRLLCLLSHVWNSVKIRCYQPKSGGKRTIERDRVHCGHTHAHTPHAHTHSPHKILRTHTNSTKSFKSFIWRSSKYYILSILSIKNKNKNKSITPAFL